MAIWASSSLIAQISSWRFDDSAAGGCLLFPSNKFAIYDPGRNWPPFPEIEVRMCFFDVWHIPSAEQCSFHQSIQDLDTVSPGGDEK
jgi:hypothetical protein